MSVSEERRKQNRVQYVQDDEIISSLRPVV